MRNRIATPSYEPDMYSRAAILDPYPHYARLRDLGPVVWLTEQRAYAVPRYAECKAVLLDDETFVSGEGVALNPVANRLSRGTTLNSDGEEHSRRRALLAHRLTPKALRTMRETVDRQAVAAVEAAVSQGVIDGVELATALPMSVVPDLIGWPEHGREHLLRWAAATFDSLGPINGRSIRTAATSAQMMRFTRRLARDRDLLPGSAGEEVLQAADEGNHPRSECPALLIDYLAPSLDTTIGAISSALYLFATHPSQWQMLRADPAMIPNAVNEVVRYESPLRAFSRKAVRETTVSGTTIPKGARVVVIYASANRDPEEWKDPDTFDIRRDASRQLGFGHGTHGCAGQGLARLETQAILRALVDRVERIEIAGAGEWAMNNIIHRFERLPLQFVPA
ncbi:cytochrome P450 [Nocardia gamkensis]|uniref:Cytochrome P450 n=1 Tax=Nocardia gamkensis TaxID=352869 RepID=A0A7X6L1I3_9NOCA|nr:cytochrome P450 [Nocardia gamkensis]NKY26030.1 cytochrome P450 [Nocardia gamkensis]NQE71405.1 Cytochrome p450 CYP199A2 [Nocardia gamkensis]